MNPSEWAAAAALIGVVGVISGALINKFMPSKDVYPREAVEAIAKSAVAMENMATNLTSFISWTQRLADANHREHLDIIQAMENNHSELMNVIAPRVKRIND